jgi:hypothetical protein
VPTLTAIATTGVVYASTVALTAAAAVAARNPVRRRDARHVLALLLGRRTP